MKYYNIYGKEVTKQEFIDYIETQRRERIRIMRALTRALRKRGKEVEVTRRYVWVGGAAWPRLRFVKTFAPALLNARDQEIARDLF